MYYAAMVLYVRTVCYDTQHRLMGIQTDPRLSGTELPPPTCGSSREREREREREIPRYHMLQKMEGEVVSDGKVARFVVQHCASY